MADSCHLFCGHGPSSASYVHKGFPDKCLSHTTRMSSTLDPSAFTLPDDLVLDVHDLATILMCEKIQTERLFRNAQLLEIHHGSELAKCLPEEFQTKWKSYAGTQKLGYFLKTPTDHPSAPVEPSSDTFLHPDYKPEVYGTLSAHEREMIFWRIRHHDNLILPHAMILVLESLPRSTKLRLRTAKALDVTCRVESFFALLDPDIVPKVPIYANNLVETPAGNIAYSVAVLEEESIGHAHLCFGDTPRRGEQGGPIIALDLAAPLLGLRGDGGEIFVMDKKDAYLKKFRTACASASGKLILMNRIPDVNDMRERNELAMRVLGRLQAICRSEEEYCRYCGKGKTAEEMSRCSGCKKAKYCGEQCQRMAWKYHRVWCKTDAKEDH